METISNELSFIHALNLAEHSPCMAFGLDRFPPSQPDPSYFYGCTWSAIRELDPRQDHPTFLWPSYGFGTTLVVKLCEERTGDRIQFVTGHRPPVEIHETGETAAQPSDVFLSGDAPQILRGSRVRFQYGVPLGGQELAEFHPSSGQLAHRSQRNRKESDAASTQLKVAFAEMNVTRARAIVTETAPPDG
jgi:hypothetical protein